jgi:conjugal transfer pilus assembly protein TraB
MSNDKGDSLFIEERPDSSPKPKSTAKPAGAAAPRGKNVKRRWMYVGGAAIAFILVISTLTHRAPLEMQKVEKPGQLVNVTPDNINKLSWEQQSLAQMKEMQNALEKSRSQAQALQSQIDDIKKNPPTQKPPSGITGPPAPSPSPINGAATVVPPPPVSQDLAAPPGSGLPPITKSNATRIPSINGPLNLNKSMPAIPPPFTSGLDNLPTAEPMVFAPDKAQSKPAALVVDGDSIDAKVKYQKNKQSGMMVAGAFAPVILLNGIEAGTSSGSRSNPLPVLIRVQDNATLPGAAKYQIKSCFALGSGYGDLSAERVYIRLARLSCIDHDDRLVLSVPIQGYVVDSDNTLGMRGKVVDRQGARLGKALLAGFASGLGGALGSSQGDVTSSALGSATSISGSAALRASGLSGVASASSQLAQFYLKEAESIFPVIEIEGGRLGSVVISEDVTLSWGNVDEQFVREVSPTNKN